MSERKYHLIASSARRHSEPRKPWQASSVPHGEVSLHLMEALYEGNSPDYLSLIRANAKKSRQLMVVGHNTGLHETAIRLIVAATRTPSPFEGEVPHRRVGRLRFPPARTGMTSSPGPDTSSTSSSRATSSPISTSCLSRPAPTFFAADPCHSPPDCRLKYRQNLPTC